MAHLTIRKLDERLKARLRLQAVRHGWTMAKEARRLLAGGLQTGRAPAENLADAIAALLGPVGGLNWTCQVARMSECAPRPTCVKA